MKQRLSLLFLLGRIFSPGYHLVMVLRAFLYRKNILLKSQRLSVPVISVGNLTLGGTGKTPMVRYVAKLLLLRGLRPAIVSRGYGGKAADPVNIVSTGTEVLLSPEMAGDEPFMLAEALPGVPVLTGPERVRVARHAIREFGVNRIVMDDGFQHLAVRRDLDLVLFSAGTLLGNGRVFPGGELREPLSALGRAHAFVITGVDCGNRAKVDNFQRRLQEAFPQTPVFTGEYLPAGIWHSRQAKACTVTNHGVSPQRSNNHGTSGHRVPQVATHPEGISFARADKLPSSAISGQAMRIFVREPDRSSQDVVPCDRLPSTIAEAREIPVFAFAGIANPDSFCQTLRQEGFFLAGFKEFKDHYQYTAQDVAALVAAALAQGAQALLTTEKDFVKLRPFFGEFPILALTIELRMDQGFDLFMAERIGTEA